jgi:hypothetical protein
LYGFSLRTGIPSKSLKILLTLSKGRTNDFVKYFDIEKVKLVGGRDVEGLAEFHGPT